MLLFSVFDFWGRIYALSGRADKYSLPDSEPVHNALMSLEKKEKLTVFFTVYAKDDGANDEDSLPMEDVDKLVGNIDNLVKSGDVQVIKRGIVKLNGLLPKPFVDFYNLQGNERDLYLQSQRLAAKEIESIRHSCSLLNYSEVEVEQAIRMAYFNGAIVNKTGG